jgi:hypothetical protein
MHRTHEFRAVAVALAMMACATVARAEESGSGHYFPGQTASFIDAFPGKPGWSIVNYYLHYNAGTQVGLPIAGLVTGRVSADIDGEVPAVFYQGQGELPGGGAWVMGIVMPILTLRVKADLTTPLGVRSRIDNATGLGDMEFFPIMLGWKALGGDLKYDVRLAVYAPTGDFQTGTLANVGKNFWTFEPSLNLSWLSHTLGTEASLFTGFDVNTDNTATNYESGTSWHLDATLAQHLPLFGGFVGVGADTFLYYQITDDTGSGAKLGGFKGHTVGIGPVVSYVHDVKGATVALEAKWLPELDVAKRLSGDYWWLKLAIQF